jgi:AcrR family transcriptional regulator
MIHTDGTLVKSRKVAQGEATRAALVVAARELFGSKGYADTSLEEIVRASGVTKGALYHHFTGKEQLFRVVFESVKQELSRAVADALMPPSPWESLLAACRTFIEVHTDPAVQRIVLLDARAVLSWEAWREVDRQWGTVILRAGLRRGMAHGIFEAQPLNSLAAILSGALSEACMLVANAEDPVTARSEAIAIVERLLQGLRVQPVPAPDG